MKDKYVEGKVKSSIDEKISEVVRKAKDAELGGMPMLTAIQNEAGDIYRVITVDGLGAYLALAEQAPAATNADHEIGVRHDAGEIALTASETLQGG